MAGPGVHAVQHGRDAMFGLRAGHQWGQGHAPFFTGHLLSSAHSERACPQHTAAEQQQRAMPARRKLALRHSGVGQHGTMAMHMRTAGWSAPTLAVLLLLSMHILQTIKRIVLNEYDERIKRQTHRSLHASITTAGSGMPSPGGALSVSGMSEAALQADYGVDRSELVPMPFDAPSVSCRACGHACVHTQPRVALQGLVWSYSWSQVVEAGRLAAWT